jgi:phage terminase large subunit-like protein
MANNSREADRARAKEILETDLVAFAKYVNPHYCYGEVHEEVFSWLSDPRGSENQLLLMPRGHLKSHCIAVWCVWQITRDPTSTIVYLSAGEDLATIQVAAIKGMFTCQRYQAFWPEMLNKVEGKRDKWAAWGFNVDHPKRKEMGIRDLTIIVKTVKGNATGLHCSHLVLDDIVVPGNAYTEIGRREVKAAVSQFASIANPGALTKAVGTRYHPADIYSDFQNAVFKKWEKDFYGEGKGDFGEEEDLWSIKECIVETNRDMTGDYLWPRTINPYDKKPYGFNVETLAQIQAKYFSVGEQAQFYAQYYNDPNDPGSEKVDRDSFQYYSEKHLTFDDGSYYYSGKKLTVVAAMDVAWTVNKSSDYTAIGVIGTDEDNNTYVLALDRFKTQDFSVYYDHIAAQHHQWGFRKLHVESNAGGHLVAREIKKMLRQQGASLIIEGKAATGNEGRKEEKHNAVLIPRVKNGSLFFSKGGLTSVAIEEIVLERPPNDDLKDVLTLAITNAKPPARSSGTSQVRNKIQRARSRFGGYTRAG